MKRLRSSLRVAAAIGTVDRRPDLDPAVGESKFVAAQPVPGLIRPGPDGSVRLRRAAAVADELGGGPVRADVLSMLRARRGAGAPLPPAVAVPMERELGRDLSTVRVHTDPGADRLARAVQSVAFTQGSDIYFTQGTYQPGSARGSHLLAHELAHVGQDSRAAAPIIGRAADPAETAADRVADRLAPLLRRSALDPGAKGDRAAAGPAPLHSLTGGAVRRRFSVTSQDVNGLRSKAGVRKGARTKDTLDKIGRLLDQHTGLREEQEISQSLLTIWGLCEHWLTKHRAENDRAKIGLVEHIIAEAKRDHGQLRAQRRYVQDAHAGVGWKPYDPRATSTPLSMQLTSTPAEQAEKATQAALQPRDPARAMPVVDLISRLGLTEAELLAIKTFTSDDYRYMNPAVANSPSFMSDQQPGIQSVFDQQARSHFGRQGGLIADPALLHQEGALHGGVLMQAMAKLEPMAGKVYRGERMSQQEFDDKYGKSEMSFTSFTSLSTSSAIAKGFAAKHANRNDKSLSVYCEFDVDDARDINILSVNRGEDEWLLLPGATFAITRVEDFPVDQPSATGITRRKVVHLRQKKAAPYPAKTNVP